MTECRGQQAPGRPTSDGTANHGQRNRGDVAAHHDSGHDVHYYDVQQDAIAHYGQHDHSRDGVTGHHGRRHSGDWFEHCGHWRAGEGDDVVGHYAAIAHHGQHDHSRDGVIGHHGRQHSGA